MFSLDELQGRLEERLTNLEFVSGYPVTDLKFCRKLGPPLSAPMKEPPRGSEIYICKLTPEVLEDEIFWLFNKVGNIHDLRLMITPSGLANRGFCFVRYSKPEEAKEAVKSLNGYEVRLGHKIRVKLSIENNKLSLYGLPPNKSPLEIRQKLAKTGIIGIKGVVMHMSYAVNYRNGYVYVLFESHDLAATARKVYSDNLIMWNRPLLLSWADISYEIGTSTSNVIKIKNFNPNLRDDHLERILKMVLDPNTIKEAQVVCGTALIPFLNHEVAKMNMRKLQLFFHASRVEISWHELGNNFFEHCSSVFNKSPMYNEGVFTFDWLPLRGGSPDNTNEKCQEQTTTDIDEPKTFEELCHDYNYLKTLLPTSSMCPKDSEHAQSKFLPFLNSGNPNEHRKHPKCRMRLWHF